MPAGKKPFKPPIGEDGQLVNVFPAHNLQRLNCGKVPRDGPQ